MTTASAPHAPPVPWPDADRAARFDRWLAPLVARHGLRPETLAPASSDAGFRRYLRITTSDGRTRIVMDDPAQPNQLAPFVQVGALMAGCGLHVPAVLAHDAALGFALMEDLGSQSYLDTLLRAQREEDLPAANALMRDATAALLRWQACPAARAEGALPTFDEAFVRRELQIFVDWCVQAHHGKQWDEKQRGYWDRTVTLLAANIAAQPRVPMHRDYMPRNLLVVPAGAEGANPGVIDFQDAVMGPITYDIASLLRDAFISWDEAEELDWAVRYWEGARKAGLFGRDPADPTGEDPHEMALDFGLFWRRLEWTVLQRQLKILGIFCRLKHRDGKPQYVEDLPRFYAYVVKTATRYVELSPLLRLIEDLQPQFLQTGFTLR
ncbi:MAG: phosphotransferase [Mitsuaria chitosanitabida]|jgi:aminoglycoside/choline kinase family phosphotransferase|uniref:aminoglycoside phosphotransferase family protein n=1 Tax=Roseateles chitosanitabidus TaxID=65048 RepID=UPI001B21223F|nr:phosphotransferase [Roseateles chitosanitabidus]MBO9686684.1 phosphotransferase [Roseateles chitosanitabidus]